MASYDDRPIIIKKVKKGGHAHHGGAWKIAYADFVTAMMAFFLLLWLISMTTDEQKKGLADYFAPDNVSETTSGAGGVLAGMSMDDSGAKQVTDAMRPQEVTLQLNGEAAGGGEGNSTRQYEGADGRQTTSTIRQQFHSAAASIRQAWQEMPNITDIQHNLLVQETETGLSILIIDQEGRPMFPEGSKYPFERTRQAIAAVAPILQRLPNQIDISGHTAAGRSYPDPTYGAWELSSDRANVVRSILGEFGLSDLRVHAVNGRATAEPFFPNDPYMSGNERIEITVLNEAPPVPPDLAP